MKTKSSILLLVLLIIFNNAFTQSAKTEIPEWAVLMYSEKPDAGDVVKKYNEYYKLHPFVKNIHTQNYKRFLREIRNDIHGTKTGILTKLEAQKQNEQYIQQSAALKSGKTNSPTSPWECIGPIDWDHTAKSKSYAPGAAHIYTTKRAPTNANTLYAGTATAGLWKSTDKATTWTLVTGNLMINEVKAVGIHPADENTVYFGSAGDLYKTTDGGSTWNIMGDATFQNYTLDITDIIVHPDQPDLVFICSDKGLFRSTDGGQNFTAIWTDVCQEMEMHPIYNDTIYAIKQLTTRTEFYKSTDRGNTFVQKPNGWPMPGASPDEQQRTEIAVTAAAPHKVFALATGVVNGGSGLYGVYVSNDEGESWTFSCCGPQPGGLPNLTTTPPNINMLGWDDKGADDGGQYYYNLAFDVSQTDSNKVYVGGTNLWVSTDGGSTFTCPAKWSHSSKPNYVHADLHDIRIYNDGEIWIACDGGIFFSIDNGANFTRKLNGIAGTDFWGFGAGYWEGETMLGGAYHNGTLLRDKGVYINDWLCTDGGDGVRGFVNFGNENEVYSDFDVKELPHNRNQVIPTRNFQKQPNASYIIGESSNMEFLPHLYNSYYVGEDTKLWRTNDNGYTYTLVKNFGGTKKVASIEVAWADTSVIYVSLYPGWWDKKEIWKSTNNGVTWVEITPPLSVINNSNWIPYDITVSHNDPRKLWIARTSQYGNYPASLSGYQVFKSTNGGTSWTNISNSTIGNEFPSCIEHQRGSNDGIYIGTRKGVYYHDPNISWQLFNNNLPLSTSSVAIEPYYRKGKIRNATNRSVYECDFFQNSAPSAQIAVLTRNIYCPTDTVYFYDHSALNENGATWNWTFSGGTPATSNLRTPKVVFNSVGAHTVSLTVTDAYGSSTQTYNDFIVVNTEECPAFGNKTVTEKTSQKINVYPNPVKEGQKITIETNRKEAFTLTIYDTNGKLIKTVANINNTATIDISELSKGMYQYRLESETFMQKDVIIKQ